MRSAVLVAVFLALCQTVFSDDLERESRILEDNIRDATSCILGRMAAGMEECGVPSFDPLAIAEGEVDLGSIGMQGNLQVSGLSLDGITDLRYESLSGSITLIPVGYRVRAKPVFDVVVGSTGYVLEDFSFAGADAFGAGDLSLVCEGLSIDLDIQIALIGDLIRDVTTSTSIQSCSQFEITGVNNDEELSQSISESVRNDAAGIIQELDPYINEVLVGLIKGLANSFSTREDVPLDIGCLADGCISL